MTTQRIGDDRAVRAAILRLTADQQHSYFVVRRIPLEEKAVILRKKTNAVRPSSSGPGCLAAFWMSRRHGLHDALNHLLRAGCISACLGCPDLAESLRPALEAAQAAMALASEEIPAAAGIRARSTLLAKARTLSPSGRRRRMAAQAPRFAFALLAALLAMFLGGGGLARRPAAALPEIRSMASRGLPRKSAFASRRRPCGQGWRRNSTTAAPARSRPCSPSAE
jgi:hypothetical protein